MSKKVKVIINYETYIMDAAAALAMFKVLSGVEVERLTSKYNSGSDTSIYYVEQISGGFVKLENIRPTDYAVWKLAGASLDEEDKS